METQDYIIQLSCEIFESYFDNKISLEECEILLEAMPAAAKPLVKGAYAAYKKGKEAAGKAAEKVKPVADKVSGKVKETIDKHTTEEQREKIKDRMDKIKKNGESINQKFNEKGRGAAKKIMGEKFYSKYEGKVNGVLAGIKAGTIGLSKAVLFGPLDWLFTAVSLSAIMKSDDKVDVMTKRLMENIKTKITELKDKMKDVGRNLVKEANTPNKKTELPSAIKALYTQARAIAKAADNCMERIKNDLQKSSGLVLSESAIDKMDDLVLENGYITEKSYEILDTFIEQSDDIDPEIMLDIVWRYTN